MTMRVQQSRVAIGVLSLVVFGTFTGCGPETVADPPPDVPDAEAAAQPQLAPGDIYYTDGKGMERVLLALEHADEENKRVLLHIGGNWCGWCHKLHGTLNSDAAIKQLLSEAYVVVMVENAKDKDVLQKWDIHASGYPYLTVLDSSGKKLTEKSTGSLEKGSGHDPVKVFAFLTEWMPAATDTAALQPSVQGDKMLPSDIKLSAASLQEKARVDSALVKAKAENKRVLIKWHADWCGNCHALNRFYDTNEQVKAVLREKYILVTIDDDKYGELRKFYQAETGRVPTLTILDTDGTRLANTAGYHLREGGTNLVEMHMAFLEMREPNAQVAKRTNK